MKVSARTDVSGPISASVWVFIQSAAGLARLEGPAHVIEVGAPARFLVTVSQGAQMIANWRFNDKGPQQVQALNLSGNHFKSSSFVLILFISPSENVGKRKRRGRIDHRNKRVDMCSVFSCRDSKSLVKQNSLNFFSPDSIVNRVGSTAMYGNVSGSPEKSGAYVIPSAMIDKDGYLLAWELYASKVGPMRLQVGRAES